MTVRQHDHKIYFIKYRFFVCPIMKCFCCIGAKALPINVHMILRDRTRLLHLSKKAFAILSLNIIQCDK